MRFTLYSLIGFFGYGIWAFLKDYTTVYYDTNADKRLSDLGPGNIIFLIMQDYHY